MNSTDYAKLATIGYMIDHVPKGEEKLWEEVDGHVVKEGPLKDIKLPHIHFYIKTKLSEGKEK